MKKHYSKLILLALLLIGTLNGNSPAEAGSLEPIIAKQLNNLPNVEARLEPQAKPATVILQDSAQPTPTVITISKNFAYQPKVIQGRMALSLKDVSDNLGLSLEWDSSNRIANVSDSNNTNQVSIPIGKSKIAINNKLTGIDSTALIDSKTGRTYIPIRYALEPLNYKVEFTRATNTVTITSPTTLPTPGSAKGPSKPAPSPTTSVKPSRNPNPETFLPAIPANNQSSYNSGVPLLASNPREVTGIITYRNGGVFPSKVIGVPFSELKSNEKREIAFRDLANIIKMQDAEKYLDTPTKYVIVPMNTVVNVQGNQFLMQFRKLINGHTLLYTGAKSSVGDAMVAKNIIGTVYYNDGQESTIERGGFLTIREGRKMKDIVALSVHDPHTNLTYFTFYK